MTDARNAQIVALHHGGHSLRAIGREVKLSHEGVRLVLIAAGLTAHAPRDRFDVLEADALPDSSILPPRGHPMTSPPMPAA